MSTTATQSTAATKDMNGSGASKKATPMIKFKSTYATMITEAIQELKKKKGSSRQAIIKQISGKSNTIPNALLITKTLKKMIEDGRLVPGAQAGKSGSGSFKLSPQEVSRIKQSEKAAAKKEVKKAAGTKPPAGAKKVAKKAAGAKKVLKKSAKKVAKKPIGKAQTGKGMKLMKKSVKKVGAKAKKNMAVSKIVKK